MQQKQIKVSRKCQNIFYCLIESVDKFVFRILPPKFFKEKKENKFKIFFINLQVQQKFVCNKNMMVVFVKYHVVILF